jgi:hypothetical protein
MFLHCSVFLAFLAVQLVVAPNPQVLSFTDVLMRY